MSKMDITSEFQLLVDKAESDKYKKENKNQNIDSHDSDDILVPDKNRILPKAKRKKSKNVPKDPLETRAREIVQNITGLREFLAENRSAYIDVLNITGSTVANNDLSDFCISSANSNGFTDLDRDKIDAGANYRIRKTNKLISEFKAELKEKLDNKGKFNLSVHRTQHLESVCDILENYLRSACQNHAKQKAIRVEKELELQKLSRLELNVKSSLATTSQPRAVKMSQPYLNRQEIDNQSLNSNSDLETESNTKYGDFSSDSGNPSAVNEKSKRNNPKKKTNCHNRIKAEFNEKSKAADSGVSHIEFNSNVTAKSNASAGYRYSSDDDAAEANEMENNLSPEEIHAYEQENNAMYDDLVSLRDNIQQIENKVVKIAQLQEVFTEKGKRSTEKTWAINKL